MKILKKCNGYALVLTIIVTMLFLMLSSALLAAYLSEFRSNKYLEERTKAMYLAEAGLEHAIYLLEKGNVPNPPEEELELDSGYKYEIVELDEEKIKVKGILQTGNRKFTVTLVAIIEDGNISNITTETKVEKTN
jgi:type II secretory pathway component PulK